MRPIVLWSGLTILALGSLGLGYLSQMRSTSDGSSGEVGSAYAATFSALNEVNVLSEGAALASIFAVAKREDLGEIARAFEEASLGHGPSPLVTELLAELWARHDPASALARASGWSRFWYRSFVPDFMRAWARRDPAAARQVAAELEGEKLRLAAEDAVTIGLLDSQAEDAWNTYLEHWPFGSNALADFLDRLARRDGLGRVIERVETLPGSAPADFSSQVIRGVVGLGGRIDPAKTLPFVEKHVDSQREDLGNLWVLFVMSWAKTDPEAAMDWLVTQPAGSPRVAAFRAAFRPWVLSDSTRTLAIDWIEKQPEEVVTRVADLYARALVHIDPERAIAAAMWIEQPAQRRRILAVLERQIGMMGGTHEGNRARSGQDDRAVEENGAMNLEPHAVSNGDDSVSLTIENDMLEAR